MRRVAGIAPHESAEREKRPTEKAIPALWAGNREGVRGMEVGPVVKAYMEAHGIKQIFVAKKCGWTAQRLSNVLNGKSPLTVEDYKALCKCIGVPYELFLE